MSRIATLIFASLVCLIASMLFVAMYVSPTSIERPATDRDTTEVDTNRPQHSVPPQHSVTVRRPDGPPRIELAGTDPQGRSGAVACSTCHSVRPPNLDNRTPDTLDEFHQGMTFDHGKIACYACHNPSDADSLRLADGERVEYTDVMTLCSQCHGPQATAFAHGAHGGMNGYWDLSRGPQVKNNCIDCHDPHAPQFPKMIVGFKPKDRFHSPPSETQHETAHAVE